jgi:hypothetical protein
MKVKNKQTTKTNEVPTPKVLTESALKEQLKNLNNQLVESQTKTVMIQGAIQAVTMQIEELNPTKDTKITNGVN